jgi:ATP-binding cassette, subfamily F, member 3
VADRLWLVKDGAVTVWEDDLDAYARMLLAGDKAEEKPKAEKPRRRASRDEVLALKAEVRKGEERIAKLEEMRGKLATKLADRALWDEPDKAAVWQKKYAEVMEGLDRAEALWMTAVERLEAAEKGEAA